MPVAQLVTLWAALDARRRMIVAAAGTAVFVAVLFLAQIAAAPSPALLYAGLQPQVAGEVATALDQRGAYYEVRGDAIYVDAADRDFLRISLAEQGLPASGAAGYELLDGLSGFGTTAQMFDAAYWRAKEGELARTILAWPQIRSARVHLAIGATKPFSKASAPTASVTIAVNGGGLASERIAALRFLVASAVTGLSPQDVSIIDSDLGLVAQGGADSQTIAFQDRRADDLRRNVERLMTALVGPGNAVVEVSVETLQDRETIVERRFDPDSRVAISTDTEEVSGNSSDSGSGAVTVASNLPEGDAAGGDSSSRSTNTETRERVNYEVSETTRELIRQPGRVARVTVAVLINSIAVAAADGGVERSPRSEAELASLAELVQSAIGFDADRGDVVTVRSLDFPTLAETGVLATASGLDFLSANAMQLIRLSALLVAALGLGLFVLRPALTAPVQTALPAPDGGVLDGEYSVADESAASDRPVDDEMQDPIEQLRQLISSRQEDTVEVLRHWIESSEESA